MKKLTYILAAAMAVFALGACGGRGHVADSGIVSCENDICVMRQSPWLKVCKVIYLIT